MSDHFELSKVVSQLIVIVFTTTLLLFSYTKGTTYIAKMIVGLLIVALIFKAFNSTDGPINMSCEFFMLVVWLIFAMTTGFFAVNFDVFYDTLLRLLQVYLVAFMLFNLIIWFGSPTTLWFGIYSATLVISIKVLQNPLAYSELGRLVGTLGNANLYALALLVSFIFSLNRVFVIQNWLMKVAFLASTPLFIYMIAGTGSRKGIIAVILYLCFFLMLRLRSRPVHRVPFAFIATTLMFLVFIGGIAAYFSKTEHFDRIETVFRAAEAGSLKKADGSVYGRLMLYKVGLEMIGDRPAIGFGLGNFRVKLPQYFRFAGSTYAHSNFIEVLTGTGILGAFLYFSIYGFLAYKLLHMRNIPWSKPYREQYLTTLPLFLVYVAYDFAMVSYYEKLSWVILTGIISSVWLLERERKRLQAGSTENAVQSEALRMTAGAGI